MGTRHHHRYLVKRAWIGYAVFGLLAIGSYFIWNEGLIANVIYDGLGLSSVFALLLGTHLHQPDHRSAWYLIAAGAFAFVLGDGIYSYYIFVQNIEVPWPSWAEPVYLIGYGLLAAGLMRFVKNNRNKDRAALTDVSIVVTSLGTILWLFLMKPYAIDDSLTIAERFWSISYPLMDFALLAVVARLLLSSARRSVAYSMLSGSFLLLLGADVVYGIESLTGTYVGGFTTDGAWLLSYVLVGMSALHPSMVKMTQPAADGPRSTGKRLVLIGVAFLLAPLTMVAQKAFGYGLDMWTSGISSVLLITLALLRMDGLLKNESKQVRLLEEKERILKASLSERAALTEQLRHQAFHDPLTGLPNRKLFMDRVRHALKRRLSDNVVVSVIFIDLDDFKSVNDSGGHAYGDETLTAVAERLQKTIRPEDTVCRLGGDEYAILIESIGSSDVEAAAARIAAQFDRPFHVGGSHLTVAASLGVATGTDQTTTAEDLVHNADLAMYRVKVSQKGGIALHKEGEIDSLTRERLIRSALPEALNNGDIGLEYQPIFDVGSGNLAGLEALARWTHPQLGCLPPLDFISVAEKSQLMTDLDLYVLGTALKQVDEWEGRYGDLSHLNISVNISSRSLAEADFVERAAGLIKHFGSPGDRIVLEITETAMMSSGKSLLRQLSALKDLGVHLALDDFGTGYSSLARLRDLPIDILKIDRSFTNILPAPHAIELMSFVISMAHRFGLTTVAEGIETEEQLTALRDLDCKLGQGYFLARPAPASVVEDLLGSRRGGTIRNTSRTGRIKVPRP